MSGTALSLMLSSAHTPQAQISTETKATRKRLRTELSISRSSIASAPPTLRRRRRARGPRRAGRRQARTALGRQRHRAQRLAEVGLRVDQELRRGHHPLALPKPAEHLEVTLGLGAGLDLARLEAALARRDDHNL